jgi:hypothetical protein
MDRKYSKLKVRCIYLVDQSCKHIDLIFYLYTIKIDINLKKKTKSDHYDWTINI